MDRLTGEKYKSFLESYNSIYDTGSEDLQGQEDIQEFVQMIDELVEEGCDLSEFDYDALYEYYLEEGKGKAALELIKTGIRSALKMPAAAPIRKTLAKGAVKGGTEAVTKAARDVAGGVANVAGTAYRGARDIATKHPLKTAAGIAAAAYDLSKGERSLISKGASLAGKGLSAAERAIYGDGQTQTAKPKPTPAKPQPQQERNPYGLNQDFDIFDAIKGHLLDEGYAETEEAALAIMANMSEEWKTGILESMDPDSPGNKHSYADAVKANEKAKEMREKYGKDWWKRLPRTQVKDA